MIIDLPQIYWHGKNDRIMSCDFYPNTNYLVTTGAESEDKMYVKLWEISTISLSTLIKSSSLFPAPIPNSSIIPTTSSTSSPQTLTSTYQNFIETYLSSNSNPNIQNDIRIYPIFTCELSGAHTSTVNICRFSPNGMYLATGSDDHTIVIWVQKLRPVTFGSNEEKIITWCNYKILRGHSGDIYDLAWSPDSKYIISGSVDNSAFIFNVEKGKYVHRFCDHNNFVQGVSWDPKNEFVITQSCDKTVRFYQIVENKVESNLIYLNQMKRFEKKKNNNKNDNDMIIDEICTEKEKEKMNKIYHYYFADQDQCSSFVRRSSFSPDGKICLLVSGINENELNKEEIDFVVWGVSRNNFSHPLFYIPTLDKSSTCVRFCPIIFKKEKKEENNDVKELLDLPYVMIFAIGTIDSVFIYGTDSIIPKFAISNIHLQSITDLSWNADKVLAISSSDGYMSFCSFEDGELGLKLDPNEIDFDDDLKNYYSQYLNIDIKKNVIGNLSQITVVKPRRKKVENNNNNTNNENNNNINNENNNNNINNENNNVDNNNSNNNNDVSNNNKNNNNDKDDNNINNTKNNKINEINT